ncbi:EF-P beta-lysylation protein EpmB [Spiribacter vilamensis]|uniref:L-lysine 2,3-aminomutase n=1 Tax=Spiribacter vilamensis TaxID=531306 RepID=A0A4Q8CYC4_9GAMM|nr:EF-P beta-lysylation protein EpmB [Spiribacter vilamensis]RZU97971.1 L-lysine 2,3-aminomutase [Spiribacter vilamensis]TVO61115.1 EF-P beta-lysylation protein EpmB [Spiribacter vilamensis]
MSVAPWQREWRDAIRNPASLLERLGLDASLLAPAKRADQLFGLRVPEAFLERMEPGNPADPLLRQVLPVDAEASDTPGFADDPVGDHASLANGGVIHKYRGRALLIATGACAINCRYCFRRHFPYADASASKGQWAEALDYLGGDSSISEVILSGGDPLSLNDRRLGELSEGLVAIPHLRRIRVHSRMPVVLPSRIDDSLIGWLAGTRLTPVMVIHANHPHELDARVAEALQRLARHGVRLYNQAVLLRGVNDDAQTLGELGERLFEIGVQPYYLHLLDRVRGAAHFEVDEREAGELMRALAAVTPGYMLPRLVREVAGEPWKVPIQWATGDGS